MTGPHSIDRLRPGRRRGRFMGGFISNELNAWGWSALVGVGLALGALATFFFNAPTSITLPAGVVLVWGTLVLLDHRRYRNMQRNLIFEQMDSETGASVVEMLRKANIEASYFDHRDEWEGERLIDRGIRCRNADAEEARQLIKAYLN
jgi:hypothetical protein